MAHFPSVQSTAPSPVRPAWQRTLLGSGGLALLLVLLAGALLLAVVLAGATPSATETAYRYVPRDTEYAAELRLDMPDGQMQELVEFATGLPGFEGEIAVIEQINDALDEGLEELAGEDADYERDVAPWFADWVVMASRADPSSAEPSRADEHAGLLLLGVRDRAAAEEALPRLRGDAAWTAQEYRGATIWTTDEPREALGAYAVLEDVLIIAPSLAELRAALDAGAGEQPSLLGDARFADQWRALPAGRLMAFWADGDALHEMPRGLRGGDALPVASLPINPFDGACSEQLPIPDSVAGAIYVQNGRATVDVRARYVDGTELPANADTRLAERLPADTFLYASQRDIGDAATRLSDCLADSGVDVDRMGEIETELRSLDELLSWAGDGALAARWDGSQLGLGAVVAIDDRQAAEAALADLRADLADGKHGDVTITETTHAGFTVVEARTNDEDHGDDEPAVPDHVLSWALTDEVVVVGIDASFTRAVLDTAANSSLRSDDDFRGAVETAGGFNAGSILYVDMQAATAVAEALELGKGSDQGDEELLGALETVAMTSRLDGRSIVTRVVVTPAD